MLATSSCLYAGFDCDPARRYLSGACCPRLDFRSFLGHVSGKLLKFFPAPQILYATSSCLYAGFDCELLAVIYPAHAAIDYTSEVCSSMFEKTSEVSPLVIRHENFQSLENFSHKK